jgi:hypothetical protein
MNNAITTIASDAAHLSDAKQDEMSAVVAQRLKNRRWTVNAIATALDDAGYTPVEVDTYLELTLS